MNRNIGFLLYPGFQLLDLSGPLAAFEWASRLHGAPLYRPQLVSVHRVRIDATVGLPFRTERLEASRLHTLLVVGGARWQLKPKQIQTLQSAVRKTKRVASVCTGAFVLAQCGLLDGLRVTTHWHHAAELQREYPLLKVESDRIFINEGRVWTSAGITAGIDLALALIEEDHGADLAHEVARELVVYYRRLGGQSQFSAMSELAPDSDRIRRVLSYARQHLRENLSLDRLAAAAHLSTRQFGRAFRAETGETPAKTIERLRAEIARERVEEGSEPVEAIAEAVGFRDPERMRRAFLRLYGEPPQALRRKARDQ